MPRIVVNTRVLTAPLTGTHRYTKELLVRWNESVDTIAPKGSGRGMPGHAWEQVLLPRKRANRLLFSPSNSGPITEPNQIVTIHDMAAFDCPETFSSTFARWYQFLLPRLARRVRHIITVSEFVKDRIIFHTKVSGSKIAVIPNGVSSQFRPEAILQFDRTVDLLQLPSREYILAVGSVEPRKNLARLIDAWKLVQSCVSPNLWLVIAGADKNSRVFAGVHFSDLPPRVFVAGHVDESLLPSLVAGAQLLIYVSYYEGFGLPALEAMASGTPVLVADRSSLPGVVGDAGMFVDPFQVNEIALGIRRIHEDVALRAALRQKGLLRSRNFSWNKTAARTWEVLQCFAALDQSSGSQPREGVSSACHN